MRHLLQGGLVLALGATLAGCAIFKTTYSDSGVDGGAEDGGSEDGGASNDGGSTADGGSTTDGGTEDGGTEDGGTEDGGAEDGGAEDPLCSESVDNFPPADGCVTDTLSCGETVKGNLHGGTSNFSIDDYEAWYCTYGSGDPWSGPERVYAFEHPGTGSVEIKLHTPCAEMDLAVLRWGWWASEGECPSEESTLVTECEFDESSGDGSVVIYASAPSDYLVIVDGVEGAVDLFQVSAVCP